MDSQDIEILESDENKENIKPNYYKLFPLKEKKKVLFT